MKRKLVNRYTAVEFVIVVLLIFSILFWRQDFIELNNGAEIGVQKIFLSGYDIVFGAYKDVKVLTFPPATVPTYFPSSTFSLINVIILFVGALVQIVSIFLYTNKKIPYKYWLIVNLISGILVFVSGIMCLFSAKVYSLVQTNYRVDNAFIETGEINTSLFTITCAIIIFLNVFNNDKKKAIINS